MNLLLQEEEDDVQQQQQQPVQVTPQQLMPQPQLRYPGSLCLLKLCRR
jgi:hypothetical protein